MPLMKAVQVKSPGAPFELVEREIPQPGEGEVLIKVQACGICHGDAVTKEGHFPGIQYPRVPGHEVIGTIEKPGARVGGWKAGQRVGVGWHGGHCFKCPACRRGDFGACEDSITTGIDTDGGYAEYMVAREEALVSIPAELDSVGSAPLLCAGRTTFGALKHSGAKAGDTVAVQGLGGLGHLAVQYAARLGYRTVVLSRGTDKKELALKLGAHVYIDSSSPDAAKELAKLGGANVIISTAPSGKAISEILPGLAPGGQVLIVSAGRDPIVIPPFVLLGGGRSVRGFVSGSIDDAIRFSVLHQIQPMVEVFPLDKAAEAYEKMMSAKVHFRSVLKMGE